MPRSDFVKDLIADASSLGAEAYERAMASAVRYVVAVQEQAGLDVVTDGEWRRKSYIGVIAELAHGFELGRNLADGRPWTIVVDKLAPKNPGFIAEEIAFLRRATDRKIKATLPAPALLGERMWDPRKSAGAYPTRDAFVEACVPILREALLRIRDAGADVVQIDDPHLCLFVDPEVRRQYDDPEASAGFTVEMNNAVVAGVDGVQLAVHLCRRAGARARGEAQHDGAYGPILDHINRLKVHGLAMEFAHAGSGAFAVLRELREDFGIGLGCVSVTPGEVDPPEAIVERVARAVECIGPERITLNPDCGFAPGSAAAVGVDEAYRKLCNMTAAARILRERFG
jgi:5-methyltetrahydropteroyltriglutamate--homocysteine methyltransferase